MWLLDILYNSDNSSRLLSLLLIFITSDLFNFALPFFSPENSGRNPFWIECNWFSSEVAHSKFSTLLSVFIAFLWFTSGLFSMFGINAVATKICTRLDFLTPSLYKSTPKYPFFVTKFNLSILPLINFLNGWLAGLVRLFTFPRLDTAYMPSYPIIGKNVSFIKNILPLNQKDCGSNLKDREAIKYLKYILPQMIYKQIYGK